MNALTVQFDIKIVSKETRKLLSTEDENVLVSGNLPCLTLKIDIVKRYTSGAGPEI